MGRGVRLRNFGEKNKNLREKISFLINFNNSVEPPRPYPHTTANSSFSRGFKPQDPVLDAQAWH